MFNEQNVAEYLLYSRIQDTLMTLGTNAILKMNVNLYFDKRSNGRDYYRNEVQFIDKNGHLSRKVIRRIDGIITIENMKVINGKKDFVIIRACDLEMMRLLLLPWFEKVISEMNNIYSMRDDKLYLDESVVNPIEVSLVGHSKLWFKPSLIKNTYNEEISPCIDMFMNTPENVSKIPMDSVYGFMHILRLFQMHQYIATVLSSKENDLTGINLYDITGSQELNPIRSFKYEEPEHVKRKREEYKRGFFEKEIEKRNLDI